MWTDLANEIFDPNFGLWSLTPENLQYPNPNSSMVHGRDHLRLFEFVGKVLGKALFEQIVVQPKFAHFFLSKLLGNPNQLNDLPSLDVELYKNLMFLKTYEGDAGDLCLDFTIADHAFGQQKEVELVPGGKHIEVNNFNKLKYIYQMAHHHLNVRQREQSQAFLEGLRQIIPVQWLKMFNEPELQVLISGTSSALDVEDLKCHARYTGGYHGNDKHVLLLWKVLSTFTEEEQAKFLRFATSCQRAPPLGFESLQPAFTVHRVPINNDKERLPTASTCFNVFKLPTYSSEKIMRERILYVINSGTGFELS
jgi:ubiquitin-protein ligase E3 C